MESQTQHQHINLGEMAGTLILLLPFYETLWDWNSPVINEHIFNLQIFYQILAKEFIFMIIF